jgi:SAM-dependent methyltransferase
MPSESLQQCLDAGRQRLYPSLTNPNYLVLRRRREIFATWAKSLPGSQLRVLDIGGRHQPYRPLFDAKIKSYVAIDVLPTPLVNVIGRGETLPFNNGAFDLVIATQVFDYFEQPCLVAAEILRVLKPEGCLLMSVPAVAPRFAGGERWRYLPDGLRTLLSAFSQVEIVPEIFSVGSFFRTLNLYLTLFAKYAWLRAALSYSIVPVLNLTGQCLEAVSRSENDEFTANYSVMAKK